MKKYLLAAILLFTILPAFAQTPNTQNPDEKEAARLSNEVRSLFAAQKYDDALKVAKMELALRERIGDEYSIAVAHFNLGAIYGEKKKLSEAARHLEAALPGVRKKHGDNSERVYSIVRSLARVLFAKGDKSAAVELFKNLLTTAEKTFGANSRQTGDAALNIAATYAYLDKQEEAESHFQRAISIFDKVPETAKLSFDERQDIYQYKCFVYNSGSEVLKTNRRAFFKTREPLGEETQVGNIVNAKAVKLERPVHPGTNYLNPKNPGPVRIRVVIDERGDVVSAYPYCIENSVFTRSAVYAARQSKFKPTLVDGKPVKVTGIIVYNFVP